MADMFTLTPQPVRVTATGFQPIYLALDIGAYDFMDVQLGVVGFEGASPSVTVELWTAMQNQVDEGYVQCFAWSSVNTVGTWVKGTISTGLLRYMRWKVTAIAGTAATISIRGMARAYR